MLILHTALSHDHDAHCHTAAQWNCVTHVVTAPTLKSLCHSVAAVIASLGTLGLIIIQGTCIA